MRCDVATCVGRSIDLKLFLCYQTKTRNPSFRFVQDPQNVDDVFDIARFGAKDPKGLEPLSHADVLSLGLCEPCLPSPDRLREVKLCQTARLYFLGRKMEPRRNRFSQPSEWYDLDFQELSMHLTAAGNYEVLAAHVR
jgi:hypothetical protein